MFPNWCIPFTIIIMSTLRNFVHMYTATYMHDVATELISRNYDNFSAPSFANFLNSVISSKGKSIEKISLWCCEWINVNLWFHFKTLHCKNWLLTLVCCGGMQAGRQSTDKFQGFKSLFETNVFYLRKRCSIISTLQLHISSFSAKVLSNVVV